MDAETEAAIQKVEDMKQLARLRQIVAGVADATVVFELAEPGRLFGSIGPYGELRCRNAAGRYVVAFEADKVIKACDKALKQLREGA